MRLSNDPERPFGWFPRAADRPARDGLACLSWAVIVFAALYLTVNVVWALLAHRLP